MNCNGKKWWFVVLAAVLAMGSVPAMAQFDEKDDSDPFGTDLDNASDLSDVLGDMSESDLEALVVAAAKQRLIIERATVAGEIEQNILYDDDEKEKAIALLQDGAKDTQRDNIDRIYKAYAAVDPLFGLTHKKFLAGKYKEVGEVLQEKLNPEDATYFSAVRYLLYGEAMVKSDDPADVWKGIMAWADLLENFPDRISFAASAAIQSAAIYETMGRSYYAREMYQYCLENYSLTLSPEQQKIMVKRLKELDGIWNDPMAAVAGGMKKVEDGLGTYDLGPATVAKQDEVIALLEDLIKTVEEAQKEKDKKKDEDQPQQPGQGGKGGKGKGGKPGDGKSGEGKGEGKGKPGPAAGTQTPSSPAKSGMLVPGPVTRPNKLALAMDKMADKSKWSNLPPREREKIENVMRQRNAEGRGDLIREYHKRLAEDMRE